VYHPLWKQKFINTAFLIKDGGENMKFELEELEEISPKHPCLLAYGPMLIA